MVKELYRDEYDFKELNNKHLKRPAVVTIKKPLMLPDEMSDILTRLLINYVPPEKTKRYKIPEKYGGLTIRAFYVTDNYTSKVKVSDYLKWSENLFFKSNIPYKHEIVGLRDESADSVNPGRIRKLASTLFFLSNPALLAIAGVANTIQNSVESATTRPLPPTRVVQMEELTKSVTVYLLDEYDHKWLNPDSSGVAQNDLLRKTSYLFKDNKLPIFSGWVEIYSPGKRGKTTEQESLVMRETVRRAFGKLPTHSIYAAKWTFTLNDARMFAEKEKTVAALFKLEKENRSDLIKKLTVYNEQIQSTDIDPAVLSNVNTYITKDLVENQRSENFYVTLDKILTALFKYKDIKEPAVSLISNVNFDPDPVRYIYKYSAIKDAYDEIVDFLKKAKSTSYAPNEYSEKIPLLALGRDAASNREIRQRKLAADYTKNMYLTSSTAKNMSCADFKIRYYSVLLQQISNKFEKYKQFKTEGILTFPYINEFKLLTDVLDLAKSNAGTSAPKNSVDIGDYFLGDKANLLPMGDFNEPLPDNLQKITTKAQFIQLAERVIYGPFNGFYITSVSSTGSVISPYYNSVYTPNDYSYSSSDKLNINDYSLAYEKETAKVLEKCQNKDISSISLSRVISGVSYATIKIKNDKQKYNFYRNDVLNRNDLVITPMDEVCVYLPTLEDKVSLSFCGVINSVTATNDAGYNSIQIQADCKMKYLRVNRTNMKPSATREETNNSPITPFVVPVNMYQSIEQWMPLIFAQSLSYFYCMLQKTTNANCNTPFVDTGVNEKIEETVVVPVTKKIYGTLSTMTQDVQKYPAQCSVTFNNPTELDNTPMDKLFKFFKSDLNFATSIVTGSYAQKEKQQYIQCPVDSEDEYKDNYKDKTSQPAVIAIETTTKEKRIVLGYYKRVKFTDPLCQLLWYRALSFLPDKEVGYIEEATTSLLSEYVSTNVYSSNSSSYRKPGTAKLLDILKSGKRASYYVYKQRFSGLTGAQREDREVVAKLVGTSQPSFLLQGLDVSLQFSNWVTNLELITDIAEKYNFVFYTDKNGIVLFTPYCFDLTTLNTKMYKQAAIDTESMLVTRDSKTIEADDNVQILKKQYITQYVKTNSDKTIVNWLITSGAFVSGGKIELLKSLVVDPVLMKKYGIRAAKPRNILGVSNENALRIYGLAWMDRQNKRYRSAEVSGIFDSRMDINLPYYIPHDEVIYLAESLNITYTAGSSCVYTMGATYGKKPLFSVTDYVENNAAYEPNDIRLEGNYRLNPFKKGIGTGSGATLLEKLKSEFIDKGTITPTVYSQYASLFKDGYATYDTTANYSNIDSSLDKSVMFRSYGETLDSLVMGNLAYPTTFTQTFKVPNLSQNTKAASICCHNGYIWDNVSAISFEELVYIYASLFGPGVTTGFLTTESVSKVQKDLAEYINTNGALDVSKESLNALSIFFVKVPSIPDAARALKDFLNKNYVLQDLAVPGLVGTREVVKLSEST